MGLNDDYFGVVTGKVGFGKSRGIFLNIMDYWYKTFFNKIPPTSCFGVSFEDYLKALKKGEPFDFAGLDEGGDIFDKGNSGQRVLIDLYQTYTIIREKKLFTCIVISSIFDLYSKFAINRVKFWINVIKRVNKKCKNCKTEFVGEKCPKCDCEKYTGGYIVFDFYSQERLKKILEYNQYRQTKKINCGVGSMFQGSVREYKGELVDYYKKLKDDKSTSKIDELYTKYVDKPEKVAVADIKTERNKNIINSHSKVGTPQTSEIFGLSERQVRNIVKNNPKNKGNPEISG